MSRHQEALHRVGRDVLGPTYACFAHGIIERAQARGLERLGFVAREGHLFLKVYELIAPRLGASLVPRSYLYLSRLSTALASVRRLGPRELRIAGGRVGGRDLLALLAAYDLVDPELIARFRASGSSDPRRPLFSEEDARRLLRATRDDELQRLIAVRADAARALLRAYLDQEGFFSVCRLGLIDVGWGGTIQDALQRAFGAEPDWPEVHGLYLGLGRNAYAPNELVPPPRKEGLIADYRRDRALPQQAPFHFYELFEQSARAPHGTTLGYREEAGRVAPILKEQGPSRVAELRSQPLIDALQRGVLEAAREYSPGGGAASALPGVWRGLERLVFRPTEAELSALSSLSHSDDWGGESHAGLGESAGDPRRLLMRYHLAYWKTAFLYRLGGPLLPALYHQYRRLRPLG